MRLPSLRVCLVGCALNSSGVLADQAAEAAALFRDATAVWSMTARSLATAQARGAVAFDVGLQGADRAASVTHGGDGMVADLTGGWIDGGRELKLSGQALTLLLRLRNPTGKWMPGELLSKHGGADKCVFNLYAQAEIIGFEMGAAGVNGYSARVTMPQANVRPGQWNDIIVRYDGRDLVMFANGIVGGKARATGALRPGNTEPVIIGKNFQGQIDHAVVWSRALSDAEIATLCGGEAEMRPRRENLAKSIESRYGREGLTLADQLRGTRELRQKLWDDPQRPRYHLMPPEASWNDINGTIYWNGRYHVFFLGRAAPDKDTIMAGRDTINARETWLHASSHDLVHWIHHPPAMVPTWDGSMPQGLFSGDAINDAPRPTLIYHVPGLGSCISIAEDDNLDHWKPLPQNPVIPSAGAPAEVVVFDTSAWREGEVYYALVGNKNKRPGFEGDSASLFRSPDLVHWEYRGPFYKSDRRWTGEDEDCACPDFFPLGNKHMLLMHTHRPYGQAQYYIGRWDRQAERFIPEVHGKMSWPGGQTSAPETLRDGQGRRIFWGWVREARPARNGWASVATLPRVLTLAPDATLRISPAPELEVLRHNLRAKRNISVAAGRDVPLDDVRGDTLELSLTIEPGSATEFGLKVRCSPDGAEETGIICTPRAKTLKTELAKSTLDPEVKYVAIDSKYADSKGIPEDRKWTKEQVAPFELQPREPLRLRVFVDRSILEVYANGRQCLTQRVYPTRADSLGVTLVARGGTATVTLLEAWDLHPTNSW